MLLELCHLHKDYVAVMSPEERLCTLCGILKVEANAYLGTKLGTRSLSDLINYIKRLPQVDRGESPFISIDNPSSSNSTAEF